MRSQTFSGALIGASPSTTCGSKNHRHQGSTSIGETLARLGYGKNGAKPVGTRRTNQPVRRASYYADDPRAQIWRPLASSSKEAKRIVGARMKAAEYYDRKHKQAGNWNGPLGAIGLEVLRELYRLVDYKTGRLEPAIATLCRVLRRSKGAVVAALARLREHGFLHWVRRSEPTEYEGAGPQVRQITNAYAFGLPSCAEVWVNSREGDGPIPDCELAREVNARADMNEMLKSMSLADEMRATIKQDELAEILARMAPHIKDDSASLSNGENPYPVIY